MSCLIAFHYRSYGTFFVSIEKMDDSVIHFGLILFQMCLIAQ